MYIARCCCPLRCACAQCRALLVPAALLGPCLDWPLRAALRARCSKAGAAPRAQVRKTALREVQLLQALRHAHIVALLDVFRRGGRLYLVFEFVERTVLEDLERHPRGLGDRATRRIMWQLVKSVEYLHSQQVRPWGLLRADAQGGRRVAPPGCAWRGRGACSRA